MSQPATWGVATVGPKTPTAMAQDMKASLDGLLSCHSDATAPAYRVTGTIWCDTATANRLIYKVWDGSAWVVFLTINTATDAARLASINPATTLASAATATLAGVESDVIEITGTTGVTSFGAADAGLLRFVRFAGALLLTHSAALQLPAATNITTAAGDSLVAVSLGSGNWRVLGYTPATIRVGLTPMRSVTSASSAGDRNFAAADAGRVITLSGSSNFTMTFDAAATLGNGWALDVRAESAAIVTLDPSGAETIDGATTISLSQGQACRLVSDGTQIRTIGLNRRVIIYNATASSAVSVVDVPIPLAYRQIEISCHTAASAFGWAVVQLSNDGGASFASSSYVGASGFATAAAAGSNGAITSGLMLAYSAPSTKPASTKAQLCLSDAANGIGMSSLFEYFNSGMIVSYAGSYYNSTLSGVNAIRFAPLSGQFAIGSRFTVEGIR